MNGPIARSPHHRKPFVRVSPAPRPDSENQMRQGQHRKHKPYVVFFDSRTGAGDQIAAIHDEYESEDQARVAAQQVARERGRAWVELWFGKHSTIVIAGWRWVAGCVVIDQQAGPRPEQLR